MMDASGASRFEAGRVAVAAGDGLVARLPNALMYLPVADAALIEAFHSGADPLLAVTDHAADDVACGSFAVMTWGGELRVALYGQIELRSDHPALPVLTGGSATWVERTLRGDRDLTLEIGQAVDDTTDLVGGVVPAGGVHVTLTITAGNATPSTPTPTAAPASTSSEPSAPLDEPQPPQADDGAAGVERGATGFDLLRDPLDVVDTDPEPAPSKPGAVISEPPPEPPQPSSEPVAGMLDIELPPVPPTPEHADVTRPPPEPRPRSTSAESTLRLNFTTGESFTVDVPLVLGRKPTLTADQERRGARAIPLDCVQVSANHLEVRSGGREVELIDLGSRNGSYVVASGDRQLVRLEPHVAFAANPGTHVQVGTKLFEIVTDGS